MQTIIESTNSFGTVYKKYRDEKLIQTVQIISLKKSMDNYNYIILLDSYKRVIFESYEFINFYLKNYSYKKRELALNALKLFFAFIDLFNIKDYKALDRKNLVKLIGFLEGGYSNGNLISFEINTIRSNKTINMYLSIYRQFFKFLEVENTIFSEKGIAHTYGKGTGFLAHTHNNITEKYSSNITEFKEKRVPKYIKVNEYKEILNLIDKKKSKDVLKLRNKLIIKLMYVYGLRISEVLGLTIEDLNFNPSDDCIDTGEIILRNRVSDKQYHHCKNLYTPGHISDYNTDKYNKLIYGYIPVVVSINTLKQIQEYIDLTMDPFELTPIAISRLNERRADNVTTSSQIKDNYYIFVSKNHTPLTGDGWNKIVRQYFYEIGIKLDSGVKKNNLSHRFRHGFTMRLKHLGYSQLEIMKGLRHTKISSVATYFNPDIEDDIAFAKDASSKSREWLGIDL